MESYTGETVPGTGQFYTRPMLLQHRKHYSMERFEVSPMGLEIAVFLRFQWITTHPPQGAWTNLEVRFNSTRCLANCTQFETGKFSLTWVKAVATDPTACIIGYVSAASEADPLERVPTEFRQYLGIMGKKAADISKKFNSFLKIRFRVFPQVFADVHSFYGCYRRLLCCVLVLWFLRTLPFSLCDGCGFSRYRG